MRPATIAGCLAAVGVVLVATAIPVTAQVGGGGSAFTGTASARLVGFDVRLEPTIGFDPFLDAGASVAEAQLDSRGQSQSFAATPHPGTAVVTLPGTVSVLTNGGIPADQVPEYPLYADASHPTDPAEHLTVGIYDLLAESNSVDSHASATDGQTTGIARVTHDAGSRTVLAHAEASVAAFRIGDLLTVHGARSSADVRQVAGSELERSASFEVASITIGGQRVAITEDGLALLGQPPGLGGVLGQTLEPLLAQLGAAGITIEMLPEAEFEDGITSAGLRITTTQAAPPGAASGVDTMTVVYTLGASTAAVANRVLPAAGGTIPAVARPGTTTGPGNPSVAAPSLGSSPAQGTTAPAQPTASATPAGAVDPRLIASIPLDVSTLGFYPVLVVAGAALFAAARLFPYLGGRSPS